nr:hypothetical protein Iba_chr13eCG9470 [Ipomoea batatas]
MGGGIQPDITRLVNHSLARQRRLALHSIYYALNDTTAYLAPLLGSNWVRGLAALERGALPTLSAEAAVVRGSGSRTSAWLVRVVCVRCGLIGKADKTLKIKVRKINGGRTGPDAGRKDGEAAKTAAPWALKISGSVF